MPKYYTIRDSKKGLPILGELDAKDMDTARRTIRTMAITYQTPIQICSGWPNGRNYLGRALPDGTYQVKWGKKYPIEWNTGKLIRSKKK